MIKGSQKKIIHLRTGESSSFEEAYFILKEKAAESAPNDNIIKEAMRIAESTEERARISRQKRFISSQTFFLAGVSICSLIFALTVLFITLIT